MLLARLPVSGRLWRRLSVFRHGAMEEPSYAWEVFELHVARAQRQGLQDGFVSLELGPGDSVSSAVIAAAVGGSRTLLVDVAAFARHDLEPYRELERFLQMRGLRPPALSGVTTFAELLERCSAEYLTEGIESLRRLPAESVDIVWSHAVLEHVRRDELEATLRETRRLLRKDGFASHRVDLRDHLGEALNSLRFSEAAWESKLMSSSGFYTNRLRCSELLDLFSRVGFTIAAVRRKRWSELPTPRRKLAEPFRELSEEDLLVAELDILLRPR